MGKKLRILFLDTKPVRRGAQVFVQALKEQFEVSNLSVYRMFLYREDQYDNLTLSKSDKVFNFWDNHWMEKWFLFQPKLFFRLAREIRHLNPDIVLCNGSRTLKYAALVKKTSKNLNSKWIYRVIDSSKYWNNKFIITSLYRFCIIPTMDASVGVSQKSLSEMKSHYGFNKPAVAIPRALDVSHFSGFIPKVDSRIKWKIDDNAFVILFLGNFAKQKRPDRFIQLVAALKGIHPNIHGLMVGDGPLKNDIIKEVSKLKIENEVTFAGYHQDVRPFIAMSQLLVLTSDTEGMPGVILEAAAMKVMSVCTNVGGINEFIVNYKSGILIDDRLVDNFVIEIDRLILNKSLRESISNRAFTEVCEKYDLKGIADKYLNFFNAL